MIYRFGRCQSSFYLELMGEFGRLGGFQKIVDRVTKPTTDLSVDQLFAYLELMSAPYSLYHRCFVSDSIAGFVRSVCAYMSNIPDTQLRSVKQHKLDSAMNHIELLMRRVYTTKTKGEKVIELKVGIGLSLLRSELLERRIQAIRLIADTCRAAKETHKIYQANVPTVNDNAVLSSLLQVPQVIGEIFGKRSHIQLIQRSTEILKFFLLNGNITPKDMQVILECCGRDEQSQIEIFKVISESSNLIPAELVKTIVEQYKSMTETAYKDQDIELLCDLGWRYCHPTLATLTDILKIQWRVIKEEITGISIETYKKTMERFCDVITTPNMVPEGLMRQYFAEAYDMLSKNIAPRLALKVLKKSLVQLPLLMRFPNRQAMISESLSDGKVMPNLFLVRPPLANLTPHRISNATILAR